MKSALLALMAAMIISGSSAWARDEVETKPDDVEAKPDKVEAKPELPYGVLESFVEIHAFFNLVHYMNGIDGLDRGNKGFHASEFYLMFSSRLSPALYFNAELEQQPGLKPEEFNVRRLEIHWALVEGVELDFGKFYCPVGIERNNHYAPLNKLISRPLPALYVIPGTWPEVGVRLHGDLEFGELGVRYEAAVVNGLGGYIRDSRQNSDNNDEMAMAGRLGISLSKWLTVGVSGYQGTYDEKDKYLLTMRGLDLTLHFEGLTVIAEYFDSRIALADDDPEYRFGYYVQGSYRIGLEPLHMIFVEPVARFDHMDEARQFRLLSEVPDLDRFSLGVSLSPVSHFQFKLEYQWLWITESPDPEIKAPCTKANVVMEAVIDF